MKTIRLRRDEQAPEGSNSVVINELPNGKFGFMGVTLIGADYPARGKVTYTAITPNEFDSYGEAEAAAITWAKECALAELYIETQNA